MCPLAHVICCQRYAAACCRLILDALLQCCKAYLKGFLAQGCSCNGDLMNAAASRGYTSNQVRIGESPLRSCQIQLPLHHGLI